MPEKDPGINGAHAAARRPRDTVRDDPGCGVLYGVLRDSAYKLKQMAEAERQAHTLEKSLERLSSRRKGSLR